MWWKQRRPEIVEDMEREVYGRLPENIPNVTWEVEITDNEFVGFTPVVAKKLVGHVDNSAYPLIDVNIRMEMGTPANATGPVPVILELGWDFSKWGGAPPGVFDWQKKLLAKGWGYAII